MDRSRSSFNDGEKLSETTDEKMRGWKAGERRGEGCSKPSGEVTKNISLSKIAYDAPQLVISCSSSAFSSQQRLRHARRHKAIFFRFCEQISRKVTPRDVIMRYHDLSRRTLTDYALTFA